MDLAQLVAGICALLLGRRLFWLFVGVMGFVVGVEIARQLFAGSTDLVMLGVALLAGIAGAVLAVALQELMIGITGFLAGGYLGIAILTAMLPYPGRTMWLGILIGGCIGAVLLISLFDWALIFLSSLVGAVLILRAAHMNPEANPLPCLVLVVVGVLAQAQLLHRQRRPIRYA